MSALPTSALISRPRVRTDAQFCAWCSGNERAIPLLRAERARRKLGPSALLNISRSHPARSRRKRHREILDRDCRTDCHQDCSRISTAGTGKLQRFGGRKRRGNIQPIRARRHGLGGEIVADIRGASTLGARRPAPESPSGNSLIFTNVRPFQKSTGRRPCRPTQFPAAVPSVCRTPQYIASTHPTLPCEVSNQNGPDRPQPTPQGTRLPLATAPLHPHICGIKMDDLRQSATNQDPNPPIYRGCHIEGNSRVVRRPSRQEVPAS